MLSQVIVTLSPLLDKCPQQVADIFQFLMVENRCVIAPSSSLQCMIAL